MSYAIGLDFGTNSVRCLVVDAKDGGELATYVHGYETGQEGILLDASDHNLARQNPADHLKGLEVATTRALALAKERDPGFDADQVVGLGVDTTGSTPMPLDKNGTPLAMLDEFKDNLNAYVWLWKDHTGHAEAAEITELAAGMRPEYLAKCGGIYSSEWFWSKILHCTRVDPEVAEAAYTWVEHADWIPAVLSGIDHPDAIKRGRCPAGHKAMFCDEWGGYPDREFLAKLDPKLAKLRATLPAQTHEVDQRAGKLTKEWADKLGLPTGIPVAIGAFDAHLGAIASGVAPGILVKIIGTSTCDVAVAEAGADLPDIPGICGIVNGSVLPGCYGLEAGQSAVGDIFNWFVNRIQPGGPDIGTHEALTQKAAQLKAGQSGLLALDWNNGNRTVLVDQRLTGLLIGQTLHTKPEEIYRALIEATAFGALTIINRFEEYGVKINQVVNCGGVSEKNQLLLQVYADVTGREMKISRSAQSCALGAAIAGAVNGGAYDDYPSAQNAMCGVKETTFKPDPKSQAIYAKLYKLYMSLHDAFGLKENMQSLYPVMKELLQIKDATNV